MEEGMQERLLQRGTGGTRTESEPSLVYEGNERALHIEKMATQEGLRARPASFQRFYAGSPFLATTSHRSIPRTEDLRLKTATFFEYAMAVIVGVVVSLAIVLTALDIAQHYGAFMAAAVLITMLIAFWQMTKR